jgi:hypothetical protein
VGETRLIRCYDGQHASCCGIDRHARSRHLCAVDAWGQVGADRNLPVPLALAVWLARQPRYEGRLSAVSLRPSAQMLTRRDEEHVPDPLPQPELTSLGN